MEKRIALLNDNIVFNIIVCESTELAESLFDCLAVEVTESTKQAYIGYGFSDGQFEQPPPIVREESIRSYEEENEPSSE